MNNVKKYLGVIWMLLGPVVIFFLLYGAFTYIDTKGIKDINNPIVWIIIIAIFTPIAIGLMIFGFYALKNEFRELPHDSHDL